MNKSVYAAIGNAAAQENANAKSINWAVSYLENTEYDWMAKQLESEEKKTRKDISEKHLLAVSLLHFYFWRQQYY